MPELPEMQALAERVHAVIAATPLESVQPISFSALKTVSPGPESLLGQRVETVGRRGKFLVIELEAGRLLVHLSQGGRLDIEEPPKRTRPKLGVVRLSFGGPRALFVKEFGTERKAGWWVLERGDAGPLASLGPEPDSEEFRTFVESGQDARRIHTMLRDQRTVAGLGRGYTDDVLHRARISPFASLQRMSVEERGNLLDAVQQVLADALTGERERTGGLPTKLGDRFVIHRRAGTPCPRCAADLRRVSYGSHEIVYCPACQTQGKVLADRRMSRLIR